MSSKTPLPSNLLKNKHWKWHIPSEKIAETVRGLVLSAPHLVKSTPVRAVYHCGDYFLKIDRSPDLWTAFRKSIYPKSRVEYMIGRNLAAAGIPSVECLGWGKLGGTNVLITRALSGFEPMEHFFYREIVYGSGNPDGILSEITAFLKKFFDAGFYHGDLHFGNILYNPGTHELVWVDLIAIDHPGHIDPGTRRYMSRCIVTLREGLSRAQMLRAIREVGAAETDTEAEFYYFKEVRHYAQHLIENWEKRRTQALSGYPKFADVVPCPGTPGRTMLLRKDWATARHAPNLERPILTIEDIVNGVPPGYEHLRVENEAEAEAIYLRSIYLQVLRVRHRRVVAFARPNELWLEPLPSGLDGSFSNDDPEAVFFWRTMDEQMIETPASNVGRLPNGAFYLTDLRQIRAGFEE